MEKTKKKKSNAGAPKKPAHIKKVPVTFYIEKFKHDAIGRRKCIELSKECIELEYLKVKK